MKLLRGCFALWTLSVRRLVFSSSTVMLLFPIAALALFLFRVRYGMGDEEAAFDRYSKEFVLGLFTSFLLPLTALAYATTSLGRDREDHTLIYLLIRPLPRPVLLFVKALAALPVVLAMTLGCFYLFGRMAGGVGMLAFGLYSPTIALMALAYTGLFLLFAVWFRHSTIIALVYALFMEVFIGNMPGIIKRVAVNFYGRSMIIAQGKDYGLELRYEELFAPVSAETGCWALLAIAAGSLILGAIAFELREYRDLT